MTPTGPTGPRWPREDDDWPGDAWPGYFSRTLLHHVNYMNADRIDRELGLADCGAVTIRPSRLADYSWCSPCRKCYPTERSN